MSTPMQREEPRDEFTRRLLDSLFAFVGLLEVDGTLVEANLAPLQEAGLTIEDVRGRKFWDTHWWSWSDAVREQVRDACRRAARGETVRYDAEVRMARDTHMVIDFQIRPLRDADGRITHLVPSAVDVTHRARQEEELRRRAEEMEKLMDLVPVAVFVAHDPLCLEISGNRSATQFYEAGIDENVSAGASNRRRFFADGRELTPEQLPMQVAAAEGRDVRHQEIDVLLPSGAWITIWGSATPLRDADGRVRGCLGAFMDATERKRANEALRESEKRFRRVVEHIGEALIVDDREGRIVFANDRFRDLFGLGERDLGSLALEDYVAPEYRRELRDRHDRRIRGESVSTHFEYEGVHSSGRRMWLEVDVVPIVDAQGVVTGTQSAIRDVTERQRAEAELRRLNTELERRVAERTAELQHRADQLARLTSELTLAEQRERSRLAQVLHDHLQQLLVGARFGLDRLLRRLPEEQQGPVEQVSGLVNEAIAASRNLTTELAPPILQAGGLPAGIEWLARWMHDKHGLDVAVEVDERAVTDLDDVRILVFQAVRELLFNVAKHSGTRAARVGLAAEDPRHLRITVTDQGRGFDPDELDRRSAAESGFGLLSVRERLALLGGSLEIASAPGEGARFTIIVPRHPEPTPMHTGAVLPMPPEGTPSAARGETPGQPQRIRVLLVDDHLVVRSGLAMLLDEEDDLEVVGEAGDGLEALERALELAPDVVLMDFSMPRMDGLEATRRLREQLPSARVIGLSMYEEADRADAMREAGAVAYLTKSGRSEVLLETIRAVGRPEV